MGLVIAPDVRIEDLDPDGFAHLCALLAERDRRPRAELQLLHSGGRVLRVVDTRTGPVDDHREPFDDPAARAAELLAATGVDRVTVIDRDRIGALAAEVDELATPERTQPELLWEANARFWAHPAVATAPEPPRSPWPAVARALASLPDGSALVLRVLRDGEPFLSLVATVEGGVVTRLTSAPVPGDAAVALDCDLGAFEEVLRADDPLEALRQADGVRMHGMEALWDS